VRSFAGTSGAVLAVLLMVTGCASGAPGHPHAPTTVPLTTSAAASAASSGAPTSDTAPTPIRASAPVSITLRYVRDGKHVAVTIDVGVVDAHRNADGSYPPIVPDESSNAALLRAAWWREEPSVAPAEPALDGSTYIYGHACPNWPCAFDDLHLLHSGDLITVTTASGVFDYVVQAGPLAVAKSGKNTLSTSSIYARHPGVLWLITCGYTRNPANGQLNSTYNWVVGAGLRNARAR